MGKFKNDTIFAEDAFVAEDELDLDGAVGREAHCRDYFDTFPPGDESDTHRCSLTLSGNMVTGLDGKSAVDPLDAALGEPEPMTGEDLIALQLIALRTQLVGLEAKMEWDLRVAPHDPAALERAHEQLKQIIKNYC